jgi:hypothetical protein
MKYFDSKKVKIFPCTYRGTDASAAVYDPEARLLSEYNLTHLPARLPGRTSYVIQYTNGKLLCNMAGYLVEVELSAAEFPNLSLCLFYLIDNTQTPKQILCPADGDGGITDGARIAVDLDGKCMCLAYATDNSGFSTENSKISMATLSVWKNSQPTADWLNPLVESVKGSGLISTSLSSDKRSVTVSTTATRNPQVYTAVQVQHNGDEQGVLAAQSQTSTLTLNTSGDLIKGGIANGAAVIQSVELGDNLTIQDNKLNAANSIYGLALDASKDQLSLVEDGKVKSIKLPSYSLKKDNEKLLIQLLKDGEIIASVEDAAGIAADGATAFSTATVNTVRVANASANKNLDLKYKLTQATNGDLQLKWDNSILNSIDPIKDKLSLRQDSDGALELYWPSSSTPISRIDDPIGSKLSLRQDSDTGVLELCWPNSSTPISTIEEPIVSNLSLIQDTTTGELKLCWPNSSVTVSTVTLQPFKISGTTCKGIYPWAAGLSSSISIPSNIKTIDTNAFKDCTWITSVTVPQSVTRIGKGAFQGCTALTDLTLPFIGGSATSNRFLGYIFGAASISAQKASIPSSLRKLTLTAGTSLPTSALKDCITLETLILADEIKVIEENACENCIKLEKLTLPSQLTTISKKAFFGCCRLKELEIPSTVSRLGTAMLGGCTRLELLSLPFIGLVSPFPYDFENGFKFPLGELFGNYSSVDAQKVTQSYWLTSADFSQSSYYIPKSLKTLVITSASEIPRGACQGCSMLQTVKLNDEILLIDRYAFADCTELRDINIPEQLVSAGYNGGIGAFAFKNCQSLTQVSFPEGCWLKTGAFQGAGLQRVTFPANSFWDPDNIDYADDKKKPNPLIFLFKDSSEGTVGVFDRCYSLTTLICSVPDTADSSGTLPDSRRCLRNIFFPEIDKTGINSVRGGSMPALTWQNPSCADDSFGDILFPTCYLYIPRQGPIITSTPTVPSYKVY